LRILYEICKRDKQNRGEEEMKDKIQIIIAVLILITAIGVCLFAIYYPICKIGGHCF